MSKQMPQCDEMKQKTRPRKSESADNTGGQMKETRSLVRMLSAHDENIQKEKKREEKRRNQYNNRINQLKNEH